MSEVQREELNYDVVIVGAGPAEPCPGKLLIIGIMLAIPTHISYSNATNSPTPAVAGAQDCTCTAKTGKNDPAAIPLKVVVF